MSTVVPVDDLLSYYVYFIPSVVLTADVFQLFTKTNVHCRTVSYLREHVVTGLSEWGHTPRQKIFELIYPVFLVVVLPYALFMVYVRPLNYNLYPWRKADRPSWDAGEAMMMTHKSSRLLASFTPRRRVPGGC